MKTLIVTFLLITSQAFAGNWPQPLLEAQEALVAEDYDTMMLRLKDTLMEYSHDRLIRREALKTLRAGYRATGRAGVPMPASEWGLPDRIKWMSFSSRTTTHRGEKTYRARLQVESPRNDRDLVQQMKLIRHPDQVVLDTRGGIGRFDVRENERQGILTYEHLITTRNLDRPLRGGLYLFEIELTSQSQPFTGWFIIDDKQFAGETPSIRAPSPNQIFSTSTPTFEFENFISEQFHPKYEKRSVWMGAFPVRTSGHWPDHTWGTYEGNPQNESATVENERALESGRYNFYLSYKESKKMGPMKIYRRAVTTAPFEVQ